MQENLSIHDLSGRRLYEPHHRAKGDALPTSALADHTQRLSASYGDIYTIDRFHNPSFKKEVGPQISKFEDRVVSARMIEKRKCGGPGPGQRRSGGGLASLPRVREHGPAPKQHRPYLQAGSGRIVATRESIVNIRGIRNAEEE